MRSGDPSLSLNGGEVRGGETRREFRAKGIDVHFMPTDSSETRGLIQNRSCSGYAITRGGEVGSSHSPVSRGISEGFRLIPLGNRFRKMKLWRSEGEFTKSNRFCNPRRTNRRWGRRYGRHNEDGLPMNTDLTVSRSGQEGLCPTTGEIRTCSVHPRTKKLPRPVEDHPLTLKKQRLTKQGGAPNARSSHLSWRLRVHHQQNRMPRSRRRGGGLS